MNDDVASGSAWGGVAPVAQEQPRARPADARSPLDRRALEDAMILSGSRGSDDQRAVRVGELNELVGGLAGQLNQQFQVPIAELSGLIADPALLFRNAGLSAPEIVDVLPNSDNFPGRLVFLTTDNKLYRWTGTEWTAAVPAVDVIGQLTDDQIAEIAAAKIAGQLTDEQIASINAAKIAGQIATAQIDNGAITDAKIAGLAASKITGQLTDAQVAAVAAAKVTGQIVASQIADAAVTTAKFASGIRPIEIVSSLPTTGNFAGRTVFLTTDSKQYRHTGSPTGSAGFIATVASADIAGQVQAAQIAALEATKITGQITGTQISDSAITTPKIAAGAVTAGTIAAGSVQADKIAANAVTADKIAANAVTAGKIAADAVIAGTIAAGAVSADEIAAGAVTSSKILIADPTNLFTDYDMEDAALYSSSTGAAITFTGTNITTLGRRFLSASATAGTNISVETEWMPLNEAGPLLVSGAIFLSSTTSGNTATLEIEFGSLAGATGLVTPTRRVLVGTRTDSESAVLITIEESNIATERRFRFAVSRSGAGAALLRTGGLVVRRRNTGQLIVDGAITAEKITSNAVTAEKIAAGSVVADKIASNAVTAVKIGAGAVEAAKIAAGAIDATKIAAGAVTADKVAANAIAAGNIVSGAVTTEKLAAGAVTADTIATNAVTAVKISAGAVEAAKIAAGAVVADKIATNAVTAVKIAAGAIEADKIAGNTITGDKIVANTITGGLLAAAGIITQVAQIGDGLITNAKIADAAITRAKIGSAAIGTAQIENGAITNALIGNAAITSAKIGDLQVDNAKIANLTVGGEKIQNGAITSAGAAYGSVGSLTRYVWTTVTSLSLGTLGGRTISFTASGDCLGNNIRILVNGTVVRQLSISIRTTVSGGEAAFVSYFPGSYSTTVAATSSGGSTLLQIQAYKSDQDYTGSADGYITAVEFKK